MIIKAALATFLALASTSTLAYAAGEGSNFTYRYTKTYFIDGKSDPVNPDPDPGNPDNPDDQNNPETPISACGNFTISDGFTSSSQSLDADGNCEFTSPKHGIHSVGFDYTTAAAFCASTMNGGGRIASITKDNTSATRSIRGNGKAILTSSYKMPGIAAITCSTAPSPCNNSQFQDGGSCLPETTLSCGRLNNDAMHYLPAGPEVEMATIGVCTFQIPQVTISGSGVSLMGEGQTMQKWVTTLKPSGYNDFNAFISDFSLSPTNELDFAHWKSNSNVPTVPRISYPSVDFMTIADAGYGTPATLPGNLVATPIASGGVKMALTTTVTFRFTPEASADGDSQLSGIELYDVDGKRINIVSSTLKSDSGTSSSTNLIDGNVNTTVTFISPTTDSTSRPRAVTLVFAAENRIGSVAFRAASSNAKFPYSFAMYATANANDNTPLFHGGTRPYVQSEKVAGSQWTRILNPAYNQ